MSKQTKRAGAGSTGAVRHNGNSNNQKFTATDAKTQLNAAFDACRAQRDAKAAQAASVAARVRALANELGAVLESDDGAEWKIGWWRITCPCCDKQVLFSEGGKIGEPSSCPSQHAIEEMLRSCVRGEQ